MWCFYAYKRYKKSKISMKDIDALNDVAKLMRKEGYRIGKKFWYEI